VLEPDYFANKRAELGMDRADKLTEIQTKLDEWYPDQVRARQIHQGVLRLVTPNSSVASELRMRQVELGQLFDLADTRIAISIGSIN
jgi:hypothetical protein